MDSVYYVDNLVRLNKSQQPVSTKIKVAHDTTKECIYVCLAENYSISTNIMTNATEYCKNTRPDNYSAFLKFCNVNS